MSEQRKRVLELAERGDWPEALELIALQPALAQAQDDFGMLPLHWACTEPTVGLDVISALTRAFPGACALENLSGMLPLHVAINARAPGLLVDALLDVHPQAALVKDGKGRYPVDLAVAKNLPSFTLDLIRKAGARAMRESALAPMSAPVSTSSLQQRSTSMDDLTSVDSSSSADGTTQSDSEGANKTTALSKAQSIGSLMSSRQASAYGRLLDEKLPSGSPLGPADSTEIALQLRELLSQLHQLSADLRLNNTSSSGSTYRSSFSSTFSSAGGHRSGSNNADSLTSVLWNPSDKFGVVLEPAIKETGARIKGFSSRSDVLGVEALAVGDVLVNINGASVLGASFTSIMRFLKHSKATCKLRFSKSGAADPTGKCSVASNPAADHDAMMYSKVAEMLEVTLKKVSAVEDTVRLSSAMSFCT